MRRGSVRVRRGSVGCGLAQLGCGVAQLGCGVAQLVARRLAVRRARVRIPARHPREVSATELTEWRGASANVYGCKNV